MNYLDLISIEKLFQAWNEFRKGKRKRVDVQRFERYLEDNLFALQQALKDKTYQHGNYSAFYVHDPKKRHIHKASVFDRVVHHLLYKYLYELFDKSFIYDSYSCRLGKGTHKAVNRFAKFTRIVSKNYTRQCWVLKLDIKHLFASVDHKTLLKLLKEKIYDKDILWLLEVVISSFTTWGRRAKSSKGIPLGNLTLQVFANIFLNELDQFITTKLLQVPLIKHNLKVRYYLRYADDFVIFSTNRESLEKLVDPIAEFIIDNLQLELHPNKIIFRKLDWGIDFLGYIVLPHYILPRTTTKKRIFTRLKAKINDDNFNQSLRSYLGYLGHANSYKLTQKLKNQVWLWRGKSLTYPA